MGGKPATAGHINKVGPKTAANESYLDGRENLHTKRNDAKSGHFWLFWNVTRFGREMQRADTSFHPALPDIQTNTVFRSQHCRAALSTVLTFQHSSPLPQLAKGKI